MKNTKEKKQSKVKDLIDELHNGVEKFYNGDEWEKYLTFTSKFINRSPNNQLLIWFYGGEDTSMVMGYKQFISKLNRIVVACVKCRAIKNVDCACDKIAPPVRIPQLAPATFTKTEKNKVTGEDEENEYLYFRVVYVFKYTDTEQIEGKKFISDVQSIVKPLTIEYEDYDKMHRKLVKIIKDNKFNFRFDSWSDTNLNGWCDFTNKEIVVRSDMAQSQIMKTTIHEIAHMFAHDSEKVGNARKPRPLAETEAESVAFVVGNMISLDTSQYSIGYVAGWSKNEEFILQKSINTVTATARKIVQLLGV